MRRDSIHRDLVKASRYMSPAQEGYESRPLQVLWTLFAAAVRGAVIAGIAGASPKVGAEVALASEAITAANQQRDFARVLFGRGAFDLARRVRQGLMKVEAIRTVLPRLLSESERESLGL